MPEADVTISAEFELDTVPPAYTVTVAPLNNGTVSPSAPSAAAGASITLTVMPEPGYALEPGTLKYRYGGIDYTPTGNGPYTFTMPASDVTIEAGFVVNLTRYVRPGGTGDGQSWKTASDNLQKMMDELAVLAGTGSYPGPFVVKAAAGTYQPQWEPMIPSPGALYAYEPPADNRDKAFILRQGVEVRGGYDAAGADADETTRKARFNPDGTIKDAYAAYETILSGDFNDDDSATGNGENAYHVVLGVNISDDGAAVLDGFTITGGNANGSGAITMGGLADIGRSSGGGMYNASSSPVLTNLTISGNNAGDYGGGMYNASSSPVLTNLTVSGNSVAASGGGMYNSYSSSPVLISVALSGNSSAEIGGGMYNSYSSSPVLINAALSGNSAAAYGGGMYNSSSSSPDIRNSIIWGNTAANAVTEGVSNDGGSTPVIAHSIVQGSGGSSSWTAATGTDDGGNLDTDPLFEDWKNPATYTPMPNSDGDYRLGNGSPAINAGNDNLYPANADDSVFPSGLSAAAKAAINAALEKDLAGNTRQQGAAIDMGAYEQP
jgi:hypothetical protein